MEEEGYPKEKELLSMFQVGYSLVCLNGNVRGEKKEKKRKKKTYSQYEREQLTFVGHSMYVSPVPWSLLSCKGDESACRKESCMFT